MLLARKHILDCSELTPTGCHKVCRVSNVNSSYDHSHATLNLLRPGPATACAGPTSADRVLTVPRPRRYLWGQRFVISTNDFINKIKLALPFPAAQPSALCVWVGMSVCMCMYGCVCVFVRIYVCMCGTT